MASEAALKRLMSDMAGKRLASLYGKKNLDAARERCSELLVKAQAEFPGGEFILVSAPGRTELGGNHTDHNHGRVLAAAVRFDALLAACPSKDDIVILKSEGYPPLRIDLSNLEPDPAERGTTASLVRGVARFFKDSGRLIGGFKAIMSSDVPAGSGMSSSACVEVLIGAAFSHLFNAGTVDWPDLAVCGQYAENRFFGKPCGLMDQMACAGGGILAIDFKDPAKPEWRRVKFDFEKSGYALAVVNTGGSHADLTEHYAAIPREMKAVAAALGKSHLRELPEAEFRANLKRLRESCGDRAVLRAMHFYAENERVARMVAALGKRDLGKYFKRAAESGASSWTILQNVTCGADPAEQNLALALALSQEYLGKDGACRVHGGGFAGTIQAYVPLKRMDGYRDSMEGVFGKGCVLDAGIRPEGAVRLA
jgi:galactokinase